jgi:hypothetical protein
MGTWFYMFSSKKKMDMWVLCCLVWVCYVAWDRSPVPYCRPWRRCLFKPGDGETESKMMFKVQFAACAFFYLDLLFSFFFSFPSTVLGTRGGLDCRSLQVSLCYYAVYPTHDAHLETLAVPLITHPLRLLRSCHCLTVHILSVVRLSDTAPSQRGAASSCCLLDICLCVATESIYPFTNIVVS